MEVTKAKKCTQKTDSHKKTRPLEGEVTCFHCSTVQSYEELLNNGDCRQCGTSLIGELF